MGLGQRGEAVETFAHVGQSAHQPHMYIRRRRDHPRKAASTARNIETRASWRIRTRPPDGRTTSIDAFSRSFAGAREDAAAGASANDDISRTSTKPDAPEVFNRPSGARRRQPCNRLGQISCRAATAATYTPGSWLSETIVSFSAIPQRRRRSRPVIISIVPSGTVLNSDL